MNSVYHETKMLLRDRDYTPIKWFSEEYEGCSFLGISDKLNFIWYDLLCSIDDIYLLEVHKHGIGLSLDSNNDKIVCIHIFDWREMI